MPSPEWSDIDWGTAPAWVAGVLGGLSLVLALTIFLRDHINAERAQVDRVGPSTRVLTYTGHLLDAPGTSARATAQVTVRDGSDLPVHVAMLAYVLRTRWALPDTDNSYPPDHGRLRQEPMSIGSWSGRLTLHHRMCGLARRRPSMTCRISLPNGPRSCRRVAKASDARSRGC
jgi:hypothetical protein